ncbi:FtsX-like permease family protein [Rothia sp. (in: high G+C Gram-positive bacteria)]|uniref:FtsX-like permease family protein n=1 Tax=Rothia sp. (in: high G+C Gram-positive bacteria) TaxID=1885016 RepID=UPI0026842508
MFRIAVSHIWQYRTLWASVLLTVTSVALFISLCINFMVAILQADAWVFEQPDIQPGGRESYLEIGANLLIYSGIPSLIVLGFVAINVAYQLKRSQALWVLAGALPHQVVSIFAFQMMAISLLGSIAGIGLSLVIQPSINRLLFSWNQAPDAVLPLSYSPLGFAITLIIVAGISYISGFFPVLKIQKISALDIRKEGVAGSSSSLWRKAVVPGAFFLFVILPLLSTLLAIPFLPEPIYAVLATLPLGQAVVLFTALLAPLLLPGMMKIWTNIPLLKDWVPWHLARHIATTRAETSSSTVAPLMVGVGVFLSFTLVGKTGSHLAAPGDVNLFDGTLMLTPLAFTATVGTVAVIFMSTRQRGLDIVSLRRSSASYRDVFLTLLCEGIIYMISALLLLIIPLTLQLLLLVFALATHETALTHLDANLWVPLIIYLVGGLGVISTIVLSGQKFWHVPIQSIAAE